MWIEAKAAFLPLVLGALLPAAAAQRVISDRSPQPAPSKHHSQPAANPGSHAATPRSVPSSARKSRALRPDPHAPHLLDEDEGMQVIAAALGARIRHASGDDCSQLVHDIYNRAGYSYPYANSWDLYAGDNHFRRVWPPQPGDLIVWQGHVGIVVSPKEHLFFSKLTSTGQDIASYDTAYWRGRGQPRFYRYLKPGEAMMRAAAPAPPVPHAATRELAKAAPLVGPPKPVAHELAEAAPLRRPPRKIIVEADDDPTPDPAPAKKEEPEKRKEKAETTAAAALVSARTPRPEQVRQAILKNLLQAAPALTETESGALSQPLIVFDDLRVERVTLDGDQGWAEVRIHQVGTLSAGHAELATRTRRAFWSLRRRQDDNWEIVTPEEATYLPRKAAVPVVAHQLAMVSDDAGVGAADASQKKSLTRLLSVLMRP